MKDLSKIDPKHNIIIKGAKLHNLKNVDVVIPRNKFTVITGLSGSGKSSLAYDTLYAEGQRRYVESLSSYARQFMGKLNKPKVDYIKGISPAIAVEQKINTSNPRSTVGTKTEIYDYLKLLFARIGKTYSPKSNKIVKKDSTSDVVEYIINQKIKSKLLLLAPVDSSSTKTSMTKLDILKKQGFVRIFKNNSVLNIGDLENKEITDFKLVVDRLVVSKNEDFKSRVADSVELSFYEGDGICSVFNLDSKEETSFSNNFEMDEIKFIEPSVHLFSFNNPFGACKNCDGFGETIGIDEELVIPNKGLSVYDDAIAPWRGTGLRKYYMKLIDNADLFNFPIYKPYNQLSKDEIKVLWDGNEHYGGINKFFKYLEKKNYKIQNRVLLSRYRGKTLCNECNGSRLRKEAYFVKIDDKNLPDILSMPIDKLSKFFKEINLNKTDKDVSSRILKEVNNRIDYLMNVGLSYLTLNRKANTLSGGETQRINLATSLGSALVGSIYVLDEPSVGLHPEDTTKLIKILKNLKNLGNSVLVVEHDEDIIRSADQIIDLGPGAGSQGGSVIAQGSLKKIIKSKSLTVEYLSQNNLIEIPKSRRKTLNKIYLKGCRENNLKNINVEIPLNSIVCITGISGSGKTTLVKDILYPSLLKHKGIFKEKPGEFDELSGQIDLITSIEYIDQNPIGTSSRSNPATYIKAYDDIRNLFSIQKISKQFSLKPKHFSFNVDGGRCDDCKGEGEIKIEMQFMSDIKLKCESCKGKRFKKNVLQVKYMNKNIDDVLNMTIDNAYHFFLSNNQNKIAVKLKCLIDVGMGYVNLGQSSSTLSGGEAQRIKLASFLLKGKNKENTLFIFDEPTTGLHFHDIKKLLKSFNYLIEYGHSIIVVEHNIDLIKSADHIIDLGPLGGEKGGNIVFTGTPEELVKDKKSLLSKFLKPKISSE